MKGQKWVVMGHRGSGMNMLESGDANARMRVFRENSILSFNHAAQLPLQFIEFDVQVTKDNCPVIFHDIHVLTRYKGALIEKRVTDITLEEFRSYGVQLDSGKVLKALLRKVKDGGIVEWRVEKDDPLCTLEEVFQKVDKSVGFNIEMKFDDNIMYEEPQLKRILQVTLKVVKEYAEGRRVMLSTFQPDAVQHS